ncbi:MAG: phytoene/squalene synthase family protein [Rhodobacteraceae bacterium]|nr:phytoene/squalene synthase family protein [Paracoccaceae bacterium]
MSGAADLAACEAAIRTGSYSFHAASRLLPGPVRDGAIALYAFCRCADDTVDLRDDKVRAVMGLRDRLERIYQGRPANRPADRAFADLVARVAMPRTLPEALLEGFAWDALGRRHATLSDVRAYSARVAAAVGAMMCVIMQARDGDVIARACDLGVAMQLTNIARDIGEDAAAGRIYLPLDWLAEEGLTPEAFLRDPGPGPATARMTRKLLFEADRLYHRSEAGVAGLPLACRPAILAARHIYAAIGGQIARAGHDSVSRRARTGAARKIALATLALGQAAAGTVMPRSALIHARPLAETRFLVEAAARRTREAAAGEGRAEALLQLFAQLEARDRTRSEQSGGIERGGIRAI